MRCVISSTVLLLVLILGLFLPATALGTNYYTWSGTSGTNYWDNSAYWSSATGPNPYPQNSSDYATIGNGYTAVIVNNFSASIFYTVINGGSTVRQDGGIAQISNLLVGNGGTSNSYILNNTSSLTTATFTIAQNGAGTFQQNGGTVTATGMWVGNNPSSVLATYNLVNGTVNDNGSFDISNHTPNSNVRAIFNQTGGAVSVAAGYSLGMGAAMGTNGYATYDLHGGTLTLNNPSTPFVFTLTNGSVASQIDFDFAAGGSPTSAALILKGAWSPSSLLSTYSPSYFTVGGAPATASMLQSLAGDGTNGAPVGYTIIYAPVPEPSTVLLVATGVGCAVLLARRRRRADQP